MSGAMGMDEDTVRTINAGRETMGEMLRAAQKELQKVFIVFALGLVATVYTMRMFVWAILRDLTTKGMQESTASQMEIIVRTPFDVILLQVKIGLVIGILLAMPVLLYYSRDGLKARGYWPQLPVARWKIAGLVGVSLALGAGGIAYAYYVFFPVMFNFLTTYTINVGIDPKYDVVKWTQFILLMSASFAIAAQLPLIMSTLAYLEVVTYEFFREKWRYAVMLIFVFGAFFSPPDPFTQIMWAVPLIALYGLSLYTAKFATAVRRTGRAGVARNLRGNWNVLAGTFVLGVAGGATAVTYDAEAWVNATLLPALPASLRPGSLDLSALFGGLGGSDLAVVVGLVVGIVAVFPLLVYYTWPRLEPAAGSGPLGDPEAIDLEPLDAAGVRAAPLEAFETLPEEAALAQAQAALDADDPAKARAILDRFDAATEGDGEDGAGDGGDGDDSPTMAEDIGENRDPQSAGDIAQETTAGIFSAFTDEETTEDDIGGYYFDIVYIFESLTSRMFHLVGVFMVVMTATFLAMHQGGFKLLKEDFLSRLPAQIVDVNDVGVVALHPVEAILFEVKMSVIAGAIATLPVLLYYAWPALKERGLARGDRNVFFFWAGAITIGLVAGSALGYLVIAPGIISYLAFDAIRAGMVISYRINSFFWLIFMTTAFIGLLADIPITMWLFHHGGIAPFEVQLGRWREAIVGIFIVAAFATPGSVATMLLVAVPVAIAYLIGIGGLWIVTVGGRL